MPSLIKILFKSLYKLSPKFLCEMCSLFMSVNLMSWLVGTSERYPLLPSSNMTRMMMSYSSSYSNDAIQSYIVDVNSISIINDANIHSSALISGSSSSSSSSSSRSSSSSSSIDKNNLTKQWMSGVKLLECRYLKESGCKSACIYLCKGPTQQFFRDELGQL